MDALEIKTYAKEINRLVKGGSGAGATATATLVATGAIRSAKVNAKGSGYNLNDTLTVATGTGGTFTVTAITSTGGVKSIAKVSGGSGYGNVTGAATTVSPSGGTGCTLNTVVEFAINTITVGAGGTGYITALAKFYGGGNANWSYGTVTIDTGAVDTVTAPVGVKFTSVPSILIVAAGPIKQASDFIDALKTFDSAVEQQAPRLIKVLESVLTNELLTAESAPVVAQALADLINPHEIS